MDEILIEKIKTKIKEKNGNDVTALSDSEITRTCFNYCKRKNKLQDYDEIISEAICFFFDRKYGEGWDRC
jgi:transcriptional antiterminator